jgi:hypothetical protein
MSGKINLIKRFLVKWNVAETTSIGITQIAPLFNPVFGLVASLLQEHGKIDIINDYLI